MATEQTHTPGPWNAEQERGDPCCWRIKSVDYGTTAVLHDPLARDMDRLGELAANARLIAVSPDYHENMLYLDSIMPQVDGPDPFDVLDDDDVVTVSMTAKAVRDIRAAIAKAVQP